LSPFYKGGEQEEEFYKGGELEERFCNGRKQEKGFYKGGEQKKYTPFVKGENKQTMRELGMNLKIPPEYEPEIFYPFLCLLFFQPSIKSYPALL